MKPDFTKYLMRWDKEKNHRLMPWKNEKNPYKIWLSEIILQQTRVEQGRAYYEKFIHEFPTIQHLARASPKKVFKNWEGLGYYTRCRNLMVTAKRIVNEYKGRFPADYESILALKGIGSYTAAAIASFAFDLPYPVVDGNVHRILARFFGITTSFDSAATKKIYLQLAEALLDKSQPAKYNQAIMDFGAMICKPQIPLCEDCPLNKECQTYKHGWISLLPFRKKKSEKKERWFLFYLIQTDEGQIYIRQRLQKDIWKNLYEFPSLEFGGPVSDHDGAYSSGLKKFLGKRPFSGGIISKIYKQDLTHQTIYSRFFSVKIGKPFPGLDGYFFVSKKGINSYPFPRLINQYLNDAD
jgi:A/G-specific adenine glycosylase